MRRLSDQIRFDDRPDIFAELYSEPSVVQPEAQVSKFVWVITKLFPLFATGIFASTTDLKKPESIALSAAMVTSTALPVLSDLLKLSGCLPQLFEVVANLCMAAGVGMMDQGAIAEDNKSMRSIIALTAVGCFSLFAMINTIYSALKLMGCVQERKPRVELASSLSGFVGSGLFVTGNSLGYFAQKEAGKPTDVFLRMMIVASLFTVTTFSHAALATHAICCPKQSESVDAASSSSVSPPLSPTDSIASLHTIVAGGGAAAPSVFGSNFLSNDESADSYHSFPAGGM